MPAAVIAAPASDSSYHADRSRWAVPGFPSCRAFPGYRALPADTGLPLVTGRPPSRQQATRARGPR